MTALIDLDYSTLVSPIAKNFSKIHLDKSVENNIKDLATNIAKRKKLENGYIKDFNKLEKRFVTGLLGEAALEKLLSVKIIDWEVGESCKYNIGDLNKIGLDCGVKTVEYGKFPLIHIIPVRSEIIIIKHPIELKFMICGLYKKEILSKYQSKDLIIDPNVRETKTCFFGIPFGKIFKNLEELKNVGW